ncbi:F0F1 ATP synthase subunit A [Candidatus Nomurabacteria bacterium]|nr:F0F1 ATP synthase subunit A [Candidatus Nomurabacteria bacterium]
MIFQTKREITTIEPETIINIGNFHIANSTLLAVLILLILLITGIYFYKKYKNTPSTFQIILEMMIEGIEDFIDQITANKNRSKVVFNIIASIFVFIGISNLIGLIPGLTSITYEGLPIFRTPTADFNTTFSMALTAVVVLQFISMKEWGLWEHFNKFIKVKDLYLGFKKGISSGVMALVDFFIGLLDIVGEIAKIFSLSLRLFGNMYAGEVLMIIIMGGLAYVVPSLWLTMNLLVGVIQALVFGSLITAYYMLSINPEKD